MKVETNLPKVIITWLEAEWPRRQAVSRAVPVSVELARQSDSRALDYAELSVMQKLAVDLGKADLMSMTRFTPVWTAKRHSNLYDESLFMSERGADEVPWTRSVTLPEHAALLICRVSVEAVTLRLIDKSVDAAPVTEEPGPLDYFGDIYGFGDRG